MVVEVDLHQALGEAGLPPPGGRAQSTCSRARDRAAQELSDRARSAGGDSNKSDPLSKSGSRPGWS
jgi:hypothetical protein